MTFVSKFIIYYNVQVIHVVKTLLSSCNKTVPQVSWNVCMKLKKLEMDVYMLQKLEEQRPVDNIIMINELDCPIKL